MSLVFSLPGKLGDALHQWPVVYYYCKANDAKCTLWLDENTLKPLVPLFEHQPCVEKVELKSGIKDWSMGGQPWDFGLSTEDHMDHEIYHLGMRQFPTRQITLETFNQVPLNLPTPDFSEASLKWCTHPQVKQNRVVLHGNFVSHMTGVPSFWRFLADIRKDLEERFDEIAFVGSKPELERARELYPEWQVFDDEGDFWRLAQFVGASKLAIGCGSCVVVLASLLGVPAIRVHDPIGEHPKVIWSNLGANQMNETERELRKLWPEYRDRLFPMRTVTA